MAASVALGSLAALSLSQQAALVVELCGKSGCPDTKSFVLGPLKTAMQKLNSTDIMDFSYVPFGQAYYDTPSTLCGAGDASSYIWSGFWINYN